MVNEIITNRMDQYSKARVISSWPKWALLARAPYGAPLLSSRPRVLNAKVIPAKIATANRNLIMLNQEGKPIKDDRTFILYKICANEVTQGQVIRDLQLARVRALRGQVARSFNFKRF